MSSIKINTDENMTIEQDIVSAFFSLSHYKYWYKACEKITNFNDGICKYFFFIYFFVDMNMELKFVQFKFVQIKFFRNGFELLKYLTCEGLLFK